MLQDIDLSPLAPALQIMRVLQQRGEDLTDVLDEFGAEEVDRTQERFWQQKKPDGTPWAPLLPKSRGKRGATAKALMKSGALYHSINHQVYINRVVVDISNTHSSTNISPLLYGRYHQFGKGRMHRPFLGMTDESREDLLELLYDYFEDI